ncbi:Na+-driven multidrug efflux pump [Flavobacterium gossypii]|uniref:Na+-driven multidrug efflux pump n=1 Tax=Flavobacterium gossypii TaxID=1646119 RepID=A0ABR6DN98_9FLAO|nr:hypothetical protein [Flavobacterium gossypii]MBA9073165.1 Na+-driven multidrug efflux pump [Flavobacterium gossypii]
MEKIIKKAARINFLSAIIIVMAGITQLSLYGEYIVYRRIKAILGYFIILPSLLVCLISIIIVLNYYFKNFKKPFKWLYLTIPSILIFGYAFFTLLFILIKELNHL